MRKVLKYPLNNKLQHFIIAIFSSTVVIFDIVAILNLCFCTFLASQAGFS